MATRMRDSIAYAVSIRDNDTCQACGAKRHAFGRLDTHHIKPRELGGSDDMENLITLCRSCHKRAEQKNRIRGFLEEIEIIAQINAIADRDNISQSDVIRRCIHLYLASQEHPQ